MEFREYKLETSRAKHIPLKKWQEHKEKIFRLYPTVTLERLMTIMKEDHGFEAEERQYIHRCKTWGLKKYNTSNDMVSSPTATFEPPGDTNNDRVNGAVGTVNSSPVPQKREFDLWPSDPMFENVANPLEKRRRLPGPPAPPDALIDSRPQSAFNTQGASHCIAQTTFTSNEESVTSESSAIEPPSISNTMPIQANNISEDWEMVPSEMAVSAESPETKTPTATDTMQWGFDHVKDAKTGYVAPVPCVNPIRHKSKWVMWARQQEGRLIGTYEPFEPLHFLNLKRSADFLFCRNSRVEAFELYFRVFKILRDYGADEWMISWARLACARSASDVDQVKIVEVLLQDLSNAQYSHAAYLQGLLLRAHLALTYHNLGDEWSADHHARTVAQAGLVYWDIDSLPDDDRSMDLMLYLHLVLNFCLDRSETETSPLRKHMQFTLMYKKNLQDSLLTRNPGPFKLNGKGKLCNPCLRSCLEWCLRELRRAAAFLGSSHSGPDDDRNFGPDVFSQLWEVWLNTLRHGCSDAEYPPWIVQAGELMGISATELLAVTCCMIQRFSKLPSGENKPEELEDGPLAREFLQDFVSCSMNPSTSKIGQHFLRTKFNITLEDPENQGCDSTLVDSIHSTGYLEMASLKDQIETQQDIQAN